MQALIDLSFTEVPIAFNSSETHIALCKQHKHELCKVCGVDFTALNRLSKLLHMNTNLLCPPPPQMVSKTLTQAVTNTKEEGNSYFKMNQHSQAVARYNMAGSIAVQRPPWEANQVAREEVSAVMSNRSAAYVGLHDYISALADAESVIALRRNWPKGHFRKAKALLAMGRYKEAQDAIKLGLSFEPNNTELQMFLRDVERAEVKSLEGLKKEERVAEISAEA